MAYNPGLIFCKLGGNNSPVLEEKNQNATQNWADSIHRVRLGTLIFNNLDRGKAMSLKIVFDFDGTLADTHKMVISAVNQIVNRETGREYTRKEIEAKFIANSEDLYPQFGIDMQAPGVRARLEDHWQELAKKIGKKLRFLMGLRSLLNDLKSIQT